MASGVVFRMIGGKIVAIRKNPKEIMDQVSRIYKKVNPAKRTEKLVEKFNIFKSLYHSNLSRTASTYRVAGLKSDSPVPRHLLYREAKSLSKKIRKAR